MLGYIGCQSGLSGRFFREVQHTNINNCATCGIFCYRCCDHEDRSSQATCSCQTDRVYDLMNQSVQQWRQYSSRDRLLVSENLIHGQTHDNTCREPQLSDVMLQLGDTHKSATQPSKGTRVVGKKQAEHLITQIMWKEVDQIAHAIPVRLWHQQAIRGLQTSFIRRRPPPLHPRLRPHHHRRLPQQISTSPQSHRSCHC